MEDDTWKLWRDLPMSKWPEDQSLLINSVMKDRIRIFFVKGEPLFIADFAKLDRSTKDVWMNTINMIRNDENIRPKIQ